MDPLLLYFSLLTFYGLLAGIVFTIVILVAARYGRGAWIVLGPLFVAVFLVAIDFWWDRWTGAHPLWGGQPSSSDMVEVSDKLRLTLFYAMLLPISLLGLLLACGKGKGRAAS